MKKGLLEELVALLETAGLADIGPSRRGGTLTRKAVEDGVAALCRKYSVAGQEGNLAKGILLFWHDYLDEAHVIAQEIENSSGSLLHGMIHRREPDYSNARYWFRRVGD